MIKPIYWDDPVEKRGLTPVVAEDKSKILEFYKETSKEIFRLLCAQQVEKALILTGKMMLYPDN